ncbi:hypothetical protein AVEN_148900-1 [Araneus ventricosus]|uniref:Endonuclease/exonuclease/phosphatase domain-containing protein n=1 Tax=Araneus ventricosus TaxID=182803 RepID=A0A4Y2DK13_ARAVE|nr:hypothetical protein AVEN_148900-1 [Araneus ventricosus]
MLVRQGHLRLPPVVEHDLAQSSKSALTFCHANGAVGWPYLTISSCTSIATKTSWEVLEEKTLSDHKYVKIGVSLKRKAVAFLIFKSKYGGHQKPHRKLGEQASRAILAVKDGRNKIELDLAIRGVHQEIITICKRTYKLKK